MTPEEKAARERVDRAWAAVHEAFGQGPAGWAARAVAHREMEAAWEQLLQVLGPDQQVRLAIIAASSEARNRAERLERMIEEAAGR
jgi:hypothetical protein